MKTQRQTAGDRRITLLQAALDLFSTVGYDGATTRGIAERVGVTEALLFKHFRSKQELLRSVVEEFGPRRIFAPPPAVTKELPVMDALCLLLGAYLDTFWENRAVLRMLFMATSRDQEAFAELRDQFQRQSRFLHAMLAERESAGELRPGAAAPATDIISALISGFLQRSLRSEPPDWPSAREQFVENFQMVLGRGILQTEFEKTV